MKYLEDFRLTQLTSDLTEAFLNTRGSGSSVGPSSSSSSHPNSRGRGGNRGGSKAKKQQQQYQQQQKQHAHHQQSTSRAKKSSAHNTTSSSPYLPSSSYAYNPVGYSSYDNGTSSSSCRVIYGRVEAYTTKRAGSDKKTAYQVGENYAHEMEKLNEAVETMKRERNRSLSGGDEEDMGQHKNELVVDEGDSAAVEKRSKEKQNEESSRKMRRPRSRSVDGVTFAEASSLTLETLMEHSPTNVFDDTTKRPLEGILKPSSNKRSR